MAAKGDVELIVRAKNEASKNLDQINKSLKDLADQQKIVGNSAGKADDQLGRLGQELARLRTNAQNLQSLSAVAQVVDKATLALNRQREAATEASNELTKAATRQQELATSTGKLRSELTNANAKVEQHKQALAAARTEVANLGKQTTLLTGSESQLTRQLEAAQRTLSKRESALQQAVEKQARLTAEMANSERVTKAQQASLDAANRSVAKRTQAVTEQVAKEEQLRASLDRTRAAMASNTAAALNANGELAKQQTVLGTAEAAAAKLKTQTDSLAQAERTVTKDVQAASAALAEQKARLDAAETEYRQVQAAAAAAKAAVAGSTTTTTEAGAAAARAAAQLATFAARLAVLAAGKGATSRPVIVDPAAIRAAEGELSRLGVTIRAAGNEAARASISSKEMEAALRGVGQAQSTLQGIRTTIAAQRTAVEGAQQAWKAAEAEVKRLAIAIRDAGGPSDMLATALGRAQGAARLAKDEFQRQKTAADQMAQSLQTAGIGTGSLGSAEAALGPKIDRANQLMNQGAEAAKKLGASTRGAGNDAGAAAPQVNRLAGALGLLASSAAKAGQATSPLRAFRNELVAMVAAGAGLYGLKEQLTSVWQAGVDLTANRTRFAVAFDGMESGNKELAYARKVAVDLKLPINSLTKSYSELALAAKDTSLEGKGARDIFLAFAQAARVNQMSNEQVKGTFVALTQIVSKGTVSMEELRQQLGDRLPGAMQLMASGLGVTTGELVKMVAKGEVTRDALLNMAAVASQRVGPQLAASLESPQAKLDDFNNRLFMLKETIAESGFLDALGTAFDRMAKALSTPEAAGAAVMIGEGLADIVRWATELGTSGHLDTILTWVKSLGAAWLALQMVSIINSLYMFATAIGVTAAAVLGLDVALAPVLVGLAALAAAVAVVVGAFAAWKLAEWAYNNFPAFAEGVMSVKNAALNAWDAIIQFWEITGAKLIASFTGITAKIRQMWYGLINDILSVAPEITAKIGLGDYAKEITGQFEQANQDVLQGQQDLQAKLDEINNRYADKERTRNQDLQDDIAKYHQDRIGAELTAEQRAAAQRQAAQLTSGLVPNNGVSFPGAGSTDPSSDTLRTVEASPYVKDTSAADARAAAAAAKKRLQLEQNVANQMFGIRSQLEQKSAQTLDQQLAAVPAKYAKLFGQLTALGKDKTSQEWQDVEALIAQEQRIIRQNQLKKDERAAAKAERAAAKAEDDSRKQAMDTVNALLQTRKNLQEQLARAEASGDTTAAQELKDKLAGITLDASNAINGMLAFWQSVGGPEADLAIAKLERMKLTLTKTRDTAILTADSMGKAFGGQIKAGLDNFIDKVAETGDVFGAAKDAFRQFAIDFLKQIAQMILQQLAFNALKALGGAFFGGAAGAVGGAASGAAGGAAAGAAVLHSGGTAGGVMSRTRSVSPALFQNAARFHNGTAGVPGLKPGEVPAILEAGETVRTQQQEKALADKMASSGGAEPASSTTIINTLDMDEAYAAAANSSAMGKTIINHIRMNRTQIKQLLG